MSSCYTLLEFDPFDNPMQLSKVGNWVFTFLNQAQTAAETRLGLTYVLPRQADQGLQIRRIVLENAGTESLWKIMSFECFNAVENKEINLHSTAPQALEQLQLILHEFERYDVNVNIVQA